MKPFKEFLNERLNKVRNEFINELLKDMSYEGFKNPIIQSGAWSSVPGSFTDLKIQCNVYDVNTVLRFSGTGTLAALEHPFSTYVGEYRSLDRLFSEVTKAMKNPELLTIISRMKAEEAVKNLA